MHPLITTFSIMLPKPQVKTLKHLNKLTTIGHQYNKITKAPKSQTNTLILDLIKNPTNQISSCKSNGGITKIIRKDFTSLEPKSQLTLKSNPNQIPNY